MYSMQCLNTDTDTAESTYQWLSKRAENRIGLEWGWECLHGKVAKYKQKRRRNHEWSFKRGIIYHVEQKEGIMSVTVVVFVCACLRTLISCPFDNI